MEEVKEKLVPIEPLPAKQPSKRGRKKLTEEEVREKRIKLGLAPEKDKITYTKGRQHAMEKARLVKRLKVEYRHTDDEKRKAELGVQINALTDKQVEIPSLADKNLKEKIKYQNPAYKEEGLEDYSLHHNATLVNIEQPEYASHLLRWSDSNQQQSLWSNKLNALETKMNALDNYLSKIRVLSGEGDASDYSNPMNVKANHYIQPHNSKMNPHHGATSPSPFVGLTTAVPPLRGMFGLRKKT